MKKLVGATINGIFIDFSKHPEYTIDISLVTDEKNSNLPNIDFTSIIDGYVYRIFKDGKFIESTSSIFTK